MQDATHAVTLRDVAESAGVSTATASRVLAQRGKFAPATRFRVLGAAEALGYSRDWTRQGRPADDTTSVDIVLGRVSSAWTDRVVSGAWRAAARLGLELTLLMDDPDSDDDWLERVSRRRSLGVILGLVQPVREQLAHLRRARLPVVLFDPLSGSQQLVPSVGTKDWDGGFAAGLHLASFGLTTFLIVLGRPAYRFGRAREAGFRAAIREALSCARVETIFTGWNERGPVENLAPLLARSTSPVGIFATNDHTALRCYESAARAHARVGHDVLIVGFDDEPRAAQAEPPLTTLHQPIEAMAAHAVDVLVELANGDRDPKPVRDEVSARLVIRASTSFLRNSPDARLADDRMAAPRSPLSGASLVARHPPLRK